MFVWFSSHAPLLLFTFVQPPGRLARHRFENKKINIVAHLVAQEARLEYKHLRIVFKHIVVQEIPLQHFHTLGHRLKSVNLASRTQFAAIERKEADIRAFVQWFRSQRVG